MSPLCRLMVKNDMKIFIYLFFFNCPAKLIIGRRLEMWLFFLSFLKIFLMNLLIYIKIRNSNLTFDPSSGVKVFCLYIVSAAQQPDGVCVLMCLCV